MNRGDSGSIPWTSVIGLVMCLVLGACGCSSSGKVSSGKLRAKEPGETYPYCLLWYIDRNVLLTGEAFDRAYGIYADIRQLVESENVPLLRYGRYDPAPECTFYFFQEVAGQPPDKSVLCENLSIIQLWDPNWKVFLDSGTGLVVDDSYRKRIDEFLKTVDRSKASPGSP